MDPNLSRDAKASEIAVASYISQTLHGLVGPINGVGFRDLLESKAFLGVSDLWMNLAKRSTFRSSPHGSARVSSASNSTPASSEIEDLTVQVGQLSLASRGSQAHGSPHEGGIVAECAQFCATLLKAAASLENNGGFSFSSECPGKTTQYLPIRPDPELVKRSRQAIDCLPRYPFLALQLRSKWDEGDMPRALPDGNSDARYFIGKMERALERLRCSAIRVMDAAEVGKLDTEMRCTVLAMLEGIIAVLEADAAEVMGPSFAFNCFVERRPDPKSSSPSSCDYQGQPHDNLTSILDTRFTVARFQLNSEDVDTYALAFQQLEGAVAIVDGSLTVIDPLDSASLERSITLAVFDMIGTRALNLYVGQGGVDMTGGKLDAQEKENVGNMEGWKQLEEQLFRRYELLGVSYLKNGDRKLSLEAFTQSVRTFPYALFPSIVAPDPFEGDNGLLKQLASVVERLTYIASCELFLPPEQTSLRHVIEDSSTRCIPIIIDGEPSFALDDVQWKAVITGALLERQLKTLEGVVHKDGARTTMFCVLQDLIAVYDAQWTPARRAGAILCGLNVLWRNRTSVTEDSGNGSYRLDVETMGREVLAMVEREPLPADAGFTSLMPKYASSARLWLALRSHGQLPAGPEMTNAVTTHIEKASQILLGLLNGTERVLGDGSSNPKRVNGRDSMKPSNGGSRKKVEASTTKKSRYQEVGFESYYTEAKKKVFLDEISLDSVGVARAVEKVQITDARLDLNSLVGLLQMNIHLLGLLGLTVLKVNLLEILKRLCQQQTPVPIGAYSIFCVDPAHEYIKLGKPKRAGSIFNSCTALLRTDATPGEVRLRYLLGQAEVLALGDNIPARYVNIFVFAAGLKHIRSASAYCEAHDLEDVVAAEDKTAPTVQRIRTRVERLERAALAKCYSVSEFPDELKNKVYFFKHFERYIMDRLYGDYEYTFEDLDRTKGMDFVQKYLRMKHVIVFKMSHDVLQFNFYDHSKVILSSHGLLITYIDENYKLTRYTLSEIMAQALQPPVADPEQAKFHQRLVDKLKYCKEVLTSIRNASTNQMGPVADEGGAVHAVSAKPSTVSLR
ncbi:hypothetical protein EDD15DRAFT_2365317 [Pisolithus albus]|nr:hypothetical protein EDD15DRAFT_2365317 [Pisolithus albus]